MNNHEANVKTIMDALDLHPDTKAESLLFWVSLALVFLAGVLTGYIVS